jgi:mutator protein MutT
MTERSPSHVEPSLRDGASIAVFSERRVLLVKRAHAPFAGLWSLPGGKCEKGETPRATVIRELEEETGIAAEIEGVVDVVKIEGGADEGPGYRLTVFYGQAAGGSLKAGGDAETALWVHLDDLEALPMTPETADLVWIAVHKLRRP